MNRTGGVTGVVDVERINADQCHSAIEQVFRRGRYHDGVEIGQALERQSGQILAVRVSMEEWSCRARLRGLDQ